MTLNINEESSDNNMIEKQDVKTSISFPEKLIPDVELAVLKKNIKVDFEKLDSELRGMRVVLSDSPSSESLIKLYEIQAKGRGYYERAAEIFRYYLKFSSRITLLKQQADQVFQNQYGLAYMYLQQNKPDLLKATKSGAERDTLVKSLIPLNLVQELQEWNVVETAVKINYNIIKSYQEQFRSVREDILVQLSIIKNLVLLGGLKVDPESMRAFKIIEASYTPTQTDLQEKADLQEKETNFEEGIVQL